ncbi:MAG: energy transducer TonB [Dysgonamonadaceae bacterium]|jgi:protein TonB|nr:energy transducer TonB [Dysgonamonadaceae bacterium]
MAQGFDLTSDKWLALIFENRNKQYGAYTLRNQSSNRHLKALLIVTLISLLAIFLPKIIKAVAPDSKVDLSRNEEFSLTEVNQDIPEEETVKALEIPPPPELKTTIQFTTPKVVEDDKITDDNQMLSQQDLLDSSADISIASIEGSETGGIDIADLVDKQVVIQEPPKEQIHSYVEKMPIFPGGMDEVTKWLSKNINYPPIAEEQGLQGRVTIRFVVSEDGSISDVQVQKSLSKECDEEAVRAVKKMPKWIPGEQNGKKVKVYFSLPVSFRLQSRD